MPAAVFQQQFDQRAAIAAAQDTGAPVKSASTDKAKHEGFSFGDFLDIINPLQHIPIVSTIYRKLTGDTIKPFERLAGDTLYGGLWGAVSSAANIAFEQITGKDFGDTALALVIGDEEKPTAIAANAAPRKLSALASTGQASGLDPARDAATAYGASLEAHNVPSDLSLRALAAYKRAIGMSDPYAGVASPIF
jgi:hypothetical protein